MSTVRDAVEKLDICSNPDLACTMRARRYTDDRIAHCHRQVAQVLQA